MNKKTFDLVTLYTGIIGIGLTMVAIPIKDLQLYLVAQVVSIFSGFLWCCAFNGKVTWEVVLSLVLSVTAAIVKDEWLLYSSALARSISYQFILVRQMRETDAK
jgi:uncharacterized membrane protein